MKHDKWIEWCIDHQATETNARVIGDEEFLYARDEDGVMHRFKLED